MSAPSPELLHQVELRAQLAEAGLISNEQLGRWVVEQQAILNRNAEIDAWVAANRARRDGGG